MRLIVRSKTADGRDLRVDLQGLRGFGVLLVLIGHLWLWPRGAFAALDIFFVLSGYFISGILIDQYAEEGTIHFPDFYVSRMRRLLPAALTVIGTTIILTGVFYSAAEANVVARQGFWAAIFASNWYFIEHQTNYFAALQNSPILHYWSLSIEEQIYVFCPMLIFVAMRLSKRFGRSPVVALTAVFGLITAAFFAYSMQHSAAAPTAAYFSTLDRAWEFSAGVLLAIARPWWRRIAPLVNQTLAWAAIITFVATLQFLHYGMAFPAPWGLLAVGATALLIVSGVANNTPAPFLVTNVPMVYLGTISYSLYLWHMPIYYLLRSYFTVDTTQYKLIALATSLVVGATSFHLLERPVRRAVSLMTHRERRVVFQKPAIDLRPVFRGWAVVALVVVLGASALAVQGHDRATKPSAHHSARVTPTNATVSMKRRTPAERLTDRIADALATDSFPQFDPPISHLNSASLVNDLSPTQCISVTLATAPQCRFGPASAKHTAIVIGDSYGISWFPGLQRALEPAGWSLQQFTLGECPALTLPTYLHNDLTAFPECATHHTEAIKLVAALHPDLVVLASSTAYVAGARKVKYRYQGSDLINRSLSGTLAALKSITHHIVVLQPPPQHADLNTCFTRFSSPKQCVTSPDDDWQADVDGEAQATKRFDATYLRTESWFCYGGTCPAFVGHTPVTTDGGHLTMEYSRALAPVLRPALLRAAGR